MRGIKVKFRKAGNSTVISLPTPVQALLGWKAGDQLFIQVEGEKLVLQKEKPKGTA